MNTRNSNYSLAWFDDFNLLSKYVSTNPPRSRLIRFELLTQPGPSTYEACYLKEDMEEDPEIAIQAYDRAILRNPNDAYAYYNRAALKQDKLGDLKGAAHDFNIAISIDSFLELPLQSRGSAADRLKGDPSIKYQLVSFVTGGKVAWINYEKAHYIFDALNDIESPVMQEVLYGRPSTALATI